MAPGLAEGAALRFERLDAGLPDAGQWRNGFALADVDGDGHVDLVHGPPRRDLGAPRVFRGSGDGRFSAADPPRFADLPFDYGDAAAADFDGDGRTDLAFAVHLGGVTALMAGAEDDFTNAAEDLELLPPGEAEFSSRALEAVDWDGDGRIDLVALGEGPARGSTRSRRGLAVFLNREDGWRRLRGPEDPSFGDSLALGDLDGDGDKDAAVASRRLDDRALFRLQRPDGSWEIAELEAVRPRSYFPAVLVTASKEGEVVELALSWVQLSGGEEWRSGIDLLRRAAGGWGRSELTSQAGAVEIRALAAGDIDGDGRRDLVAGNDRGEIDLFLGRQDGSLAAQRSSSLAGAGGGCSVYDARLADIDADRRPELILAFAGEPAQGRCETGGSLQIWRAR